MASEDQNILDSNQKITEDINKVETLTQMMMDIKEKSEDDFEKNITYISAGTLVLSLTFLDKVVHVQDSSYIGALMWAWIFLVGTLLINLASHQLSSWFADLAYVEIIKGDERHVQKLNRRNWIMRGINILTIATLICGISLLTYFATKTAYAMADKKHEEQLRPQTIEPDTFKGRTLMPGIAPGGNTTQTSPQPPSTGSSAGGNSSGTTQTPKKD
jgi:hypothetical protein